MKGKQLIFVYNADNNLFSSITDFAHKILSPSTYQCQLCKLTYGNLTMKQEWKSFIQNLTIESVFLHKNEFLREYKTEALFPAVFMRESNTIKSFITKDEIEKINSLGDLKELVSDKLKIYDQHHHTNLQ